MTNKRPVIQDARISLRVSDDMKGRAREAARREGMSLSEAIRQSLRELAKQSD
jgi:antitoxin component of RelBE/YafQ-DinJ toxin-antitoxin module